MAIYKKKYYWGRELYNSKTGLYKGENRFSTGAGATLDWKDRVIERTNSKTGAFAKVYDD